MNSPTDTRRLRDLANAIGSVLANPTDDTARRTAGRLAAVAAMLLLDRDDDRGRLMLDSLRDGLARAAPSSPCEPPGIQPTQASAESPDASTRRGGGGRGVGKCEPLNRRTDVQSLSKILTR